MDDDAPVNEELPSGDAPGTTPEERVIPADPMVGVGVFEGDSSEPGGDGFVPPD